MYYLLCSYWAEKFLFGLKVLIGRVPIGQKCSYWPCSYWAHPPSLFDLKIPANSGYDWACSYLPPYLFLLTKKSPVSGLTIIVGYNSL